jgi:hypothetical protein
MTDQGPLRIVALVEMAAGHAEAGSRYEDEVLALLTRYGGTVERRLRTADGSSEVQILAFGSRAGYEAVLADPQRLALRDALGDAAPTTRVLEVSDVP